MKETTIKELYAGKPDAKDEIAFEGNETFIKTFVVADHFNIESLCSGTQCFITGYKGTGKTALLFYLDNLLKNRDSQTSTSFIFFKDSYSELRRKRLDGFSKRVQSSITVENNTMVQVSEFEYVWRWLIFKQIVSDNEFYGRNLFDDNDEWRHFEKLISSIKDPEDTRKVFLPEKIRVAFSLHDCYTNNSSAIEVDLNRQDSKLYRDFIILIDKAEEAFSNVSRTDIPYYIFIDELEAYYGDRTVFERDLKMIRDLLFTVKRFNTIFASNSMGTTKIICSVRTEIINAIQRFVVSKELNKVTAGFSVSLNWNYTNTTSFLHPIIQILLKRIRNCIKYDITDQELYKKWFPDEIHGIEPVSYVLNNSWLKPRDVVRLITAAQNCLYNDDTCFSERVMNSLMSDYSEESLNEIKEELRALYNAASIDAIIDCFTGYKMYFSFNDLQKRVKKYYKGTILESNLNGIVQDLYRLGFLGNFLPETKVYRWSHKGDSQVIISDEWRLFIHNALHSSLSLGSKTEYGHNTLRNPEKGDVVRATITTVIQYFAYYEIAFYGKKYRGCTRANVFSEFLKKKVNDLKCEVKIGDTFRAVLESYDKDRDLWCVKPLERIESDVDESSIINHE